jgi:hypothetical protein
MLPQRSVIPDAELCHGAGGKPVCLPLTGSSELDDPPRDKFGYLVPRAGGKLKLGAHSVKRPLHGFNVLGFESDGLGNGSWHRGAIDV